MEAIEFIRKRFGFDQDWLDGLAVIKEQGAIFIGTRAVMEFNLVKPLRRGMRLCRVFPYSVKPTTFAMQLLGKGARAGVVRVNEQAAKELINGSEIEIDAGVDNGFVLIVWQNFVVGVGFYKKPVLKSHIPKVRPVD